MEMSLHFNRNVIFFQFKYCPDEKVKIMKKKILLEFWRVSSKHMYKCVVLFSRMVSPVQLRTRIGSHFRIGLFLLENHKQIVDPDEAAPVLRAGNMDINPIALKTAKTLWSFGRSECNRVNQ